MAIADVPLRHDVWVNVVESRCELGLEGPEVE